MDEGGRATAAVELLESRPVKVLANFVLAFVLSGVSDHDGFASGVYGLRAVFWRGLLVVGWRRCCGRRGSSEACLGPSLDELDLRARRDVWGVVRCIDPDTRAAKFSQSCFPSSLFRGSSFGGRRDGGGVCGKRCEYLGFLYNWDIMIQ